MGNTIIPLTAPPTHPLPLYTMTPLGTLTSREGEVFTMYIGVDVSTARVIKEKSLDTNDRDLQTHTSDKKRFGEGAYEKWYAKGRTPFTLIHRNSGELAALVWFGLKPLGRKSLKYLSDLEQEKELEQKEHVWHTLVYRSYAPFRGKGLMGDFVRFCIGKYKGDHPQAKLWVGLSTDNTASMALAERLGFTRRDDLYDAEKNWIAMTLE